MSRRRRESSWLELIPPVGALIVLSILFVPGFKQMMGALLYLALVVLILYVAAMIGWKLWQRSRGEETGSATAPAARQSESVLTRDLLRELEWKRFEDLVAAYVRELGHEARTTRIGADGGVDVEVIDKTTGKVSSLIQCKAWDAYKVSVKPVRELLGVMSAAKITEGGFFTTGDFTSEAREFAAQNQLDLVDGDEFLDRIRQLPPEARRRLYATATNGDYTTPTCPSCGVKMLRRTAARGRNEGSDFWGCRNYPRCKQTFKLSAP